jgi:hypothetical protein
MGGAVEEGNPYQNRVLYAVFRPNSPRDAIFVDFLASGSRKPA